MIEDLALRFLIGGLIVSAFAVLGDMIKPESLGGLFAAAPTIALATLALTLKKEGAQYVAIEARSMIAGACAFAIYASAVSFALMRYRTRAMRTASMLMLLWFGTAAGLWAVWLRR